MAESNGLIAAKGSVTLACSPVNYGVNHARWNRPNDYLPWTKLRLLRKFGGHPQHETDGTTLYEGSSNSLFVVPSAVAASTGFNYQGSFSGGGVGYVGDGNGLTGVSFAGGGSITDPTSAPSGPISTFDRTSGTAYYGGGNGSYFATGGSGTGAKIKFTSTGFIGDGFFNVALTVDVAGTGYQVGDVLTIPSSVLPPGSDTFVITVTAFVIINTPGTVSYVVTPTTSTGSGSGAVVTVTRSGYLGQSGWTVTSVTVNTGAEGGGYAIGNTLTVSSSLIGGGSSLTLTVTSIISSGMSTVAYLNVASTAVSGTGTGATFDVYRTGPAGSYSNITTVVQRNAGTGFVTGNQVKILAAAIGGTSGGATDLTLTSGTVGSTGGTISTVAYTQTAIRAVAGWAGATVNTGGTIASEASKTYTKVPLYTTLGAGTGAVATITRNNSGVINGVTITSTGSGYIVGDLLIAPASLIGGTTTSTTQYGDDSAFHVYDDGTRTFTSTPPAYTQPPGPDYTGTALKGKEVFYAVFALYPTSGSTTAWINLSKTSSIAVKDTGMLSYLKSHLPATYFDDSVTESDLQDFLSLFAFHLELYKTQTTHVFQMTDAQLTDASLLRAFLNQIGVKFEDVQDVSTGRQVMDNFGSILTQKGSVAGIKQLIKSYTGYNSTITNGINLLPGINTSSFEQNVGWWYPGLYATSTTDATKLGVGFFVDNLSIEAMSAGSNAFHAPYTATGSTNAASGFARVRNNTGVTQNMSWAVGPARSLISAKSTEIIDGITYDSLDITPMVAAVGDYVITPTDYTTTTAVSVVPGTRIKSITSTGYSVLDTRLGTGLNADVGDEIWFSKTATDKQGASTAFVPVSQNMPYAFSAYTSYGTNAAAVSTVTSYIIWRDLAGSVISTTPSTGISVSTAVQTNGSYYRSTVSGLPPATAAYAEPSIAFSSLPNGSSYYIDAAMFNQGVLITRKARSSATATITTAEPHTFTAGAQVTVSGVGSPFDGTYPIASVASTTFTYTTTTSGTVTSTTSTGFAASPRLYEDARKVVITVDATPTSDTAGVIASKKARLANTLADAITLTQTPINTQGTGVTATVTSLVLTNIARGTSYGITAVSGSGSVITYTTDSIAHGLLAGDRVQITGINPTVYNLPNAVISSVPTTTTFQIAGATTTAYVSGGNVDRLAESELRLTTLNDHKFEPGQIADLFYYPNSLIVGTPDSKTIIAKTTLSTGPGTTVTSTQLVSVNNGASNNYFIQ